MPQYLCKFKQNLKLHDSACNTKLLARSLVFSLLHSILAADQDSFERQPRYMKCFSDLKQLTTPSLHNTTKFFSGAYWKFVAIASRTYKYYKNVTACNIYDNLLLERNLIYCLWCIKNSKNEFAVRSGRDCFSNIQFDWWI